MGLEQAARQIIVDWDSGIHLHEAITAMREALVKQAEQEPVAIDWDKAHEVLCDVWSRVISADDGFDAIQDLIYAAPVRTKDLTDDEIVHLVNSVWFLDELVVAKVNFARAVIAADREKNK